MEGIPNLCKTALTRCTIMSGRARHARAQRIQTGAPIYTNASRPQPTTTTTLPQNAILSKVPSA
jgi:hypothetical protein